MLLGRIRYEAGVFSIVVAEGRRKGMLVLETHHVPAGAAVIAAVFRRGEHAEHRQRAHAVEERSAIDCLQMGELILRPGAGERSRRRIGGAKRRLKFCQSSTEIRRPGGKER